MEIQSDQQALKDRSGATADDIIKHSDSPCQRLVGDGDSQASGHSIPSLPEDIWHHIHSLMPMDAAARAACVSRAFLSSWRHYPELTICSEKFMAVAGRGSLVRRIDNFLKKHSGIGLKILRLNVLNDCRLFPYIDGWLKAAVTPGIELLNVTLHDYHNFPCSVLSPAGVRNSIRCLQILHCSFRPTAAELGPFRSLTSLFLNSVRIKGDQLECLLSNSLALESLQVIECSQIVALKIPSELQQLNSLYVGGCYAIKFLENKAPSISSFGLSKVLPKFELGEASQLIKVLKLDCRNSVGYACDVLPSIMPNLETIDLSSTYEENTPMLRSKFVNLKHLNIQMTSATLSPSYLYSSLISFLDASPCLETWWLQAPREDKGHELVGSSDLRQLLPKRRHDRLKIMEITGFNSTKSLVELTCCIVESAVSLDRLKLSTLPYYGKSPCCFDGYSIKCYAKSEIEESSRAVEAITRYIKDKIAPTTKLTVMEPCPQCIANAEEDDGSDLFNILHHILN